MAAHFDLASLTKNLNEIYNVRAKIIMGYELHIIRRNDWQNDEEGSNISLEEWLEYVKNDKELELTNGYLIKIPGTESSFQDVPGFCNWTAHSKKVNDDTPWFAYGYGMISAKYPDGETIKKMIAIADKLSGKVQGDDGEFYDDDYLINNTGRMSTDNAKQVDKKPWWKLW